MLALLLYMLSGSSAAPREFFPGYTRFNHFQPHILQSGVDFLERGAYHARREENELARPFLEMAVKSDPGNAMHHFNLARDYLLLNFLEPALFHFNAAVLLNPEHDQNPVSKANVGHLSKILGVDMVLWNQKYGGIIKAYATGGSFDANDGFFEDDHYEQDDDYGEGDKAEIGRAHV